MKNKKGHAGLGMRETSGNEAKVCKHEHTLTNPSTDLTISLALDLKRLRTTGSSWGAATSRCEGEIIKKPR